MREKERKGWEKYRDELIGWIEDLGPQIADARREKDERTLRNLLDFRESYLHGLSLVYDTLNPPSN